MNGRRVCDTDAVVERIDRAWLVLVKSPRIARSSTTAVAISTGIGLLLGLGALYGAGASYPVHTPASCWAALSAPVWMPAGAGAFAYWMNREVDEEVYYRRP